MAVGLLALNRVYSGDHLPLDVAGGFGLGLASGTVLAYSSYLGGGNDEYVNAIALEDGLKSIEQAHDSNLGAKV